MFCLGTAALFVVQCLFGGQPLRQLLLRRLLGVLPAANGLRQARFRRQFLLCCKGQCAFLLQPGAYFLDKLHLDAVTHFDLSGDLAFVLGFILSDGTGMCFGAGARLCGELRIDLGLNPVTRFENGSVFRLIFIVAERNQTDLVECGHVSPRSTVKAQNGHEAKLTVSGDRYASNKWGKAAHFTDQAGYAAPCRYHATQINRALVQVTYSWRGPYSHSIIYRHLGVLILLIFL